jgi:hypothetical protein
VDTAKQVLEAARLRTLALASGDPQELLSFLHPEFRWYSRTGERFDRDSYVKANTAPGTRWAGQELSEVEIVAHEQTAVLRCQTVDAVDHGAGVEELRMPMTLVWVRYDDRWVCLAGHNGPSLS